jgi:hypothetical protein
MKAIRVSLEMALFVLYPVLVILVVVLSVM